MKKFRLFCLTLLMILSCFILAPSKAHAQGDLDYIEKYEITIEPCDNGNLKMTYHFIWNVLDDTYDGPLDSIEIGIWNNKVKDLTALSNNIADIYVSDERVMIDLDRAYYAGETLDFSFSFIQRYCATIKDNTVEYRFNPGWFDEIRVGHLTVAWKIPEEVCLYSNCSGHDKEWRYWYAELDHSETIDVDLKIKDSYFTNLDTKETYSNYKLREVLMVVLIAGSFLSFMILLVLLVTYYAREKSDGYDYYCGFTGRHWYYHTHHPMHDRGVNRHGNPVKTHTSVVASSSGSGGHSSSGGGCACACACACAGGGRAGCSRKDFTEENSLKNSKEDCE